MDDNILAVLETVSDRAAAAARHSHNKKYYSAPMHDLPERLRPMRDLTASPSPSPAPGETLRRSGQITLRLDSDPQDILSGFVFGSHHGICDFIIGNADPGGVSARHFSIKIHEQTGFPMLEDTSASGTSVVYVGVDGIEQGNGQVRIGGFWILFHFPRYCRVVVRKDIVFNIRVNPQRYGEPEYLAKIIAHLDRVSAATPSISNLAVQSRILTAAQTASLGDYVH